MNKGQIDLKCSNFLANVFSSFNTLHNSDLFTDVTLVSDDNKTIQAHKLILSAGSEYFRDILSDKSHPHPMLCLDGISSEYLACIIKYLYVGEVSVPQSNLQKFLMIANKLKCFGLNEEGPEKEKGQGQNFDNDISHIVENGPQTTPIATLLDTNNIVDLCGNISQELVDVKAEAEITNEPSTDFENEHEIFNIAANENGIEDTPIEDQSFLNDNDDIDVSYDSDHELVDVVEAEAETTNKTSFDLNKVRTRVIKKGYKVKNFPVCRLNGKPISKDQLYKLLSVHYHFKLDGFYQCNHCKNSTKSLGHMIEHTQKHIQNLEFDCDICGKIFQGTNLLRHHKRRWHTKNLHLRNEKAKCSNCEKQFSKDYLAYKHIQTCTKSQKPTKMTYVKNIEMGNAKHDMEVDRYASIYVHSM